MIVWLRIHARATYTRICIRCVQIKTRTHLFVMCACTRVRYTFARARIYAHTIAHATIAIIVYAILCVLYAIATIAIVDIAYLYIVHYSCTYTCVRMCIRWHMYTCVVNVLLRLHTFTCVFVERHIQFALYVCVQFVLQSRCVCVIMQWHWHRNCTHAFVDCTFYTRVIRVIRRTICHTFNIQCVNCTFLFARRAFDNKRHRIVIVCYDMFRCHVRSRTHSHVCIRLCTCTCVRVRVSCFWLYTFLCVVQLHLHCNMRECCNHIAMLHARVHASYITRYVVYTYNVQPARITQYIQKHILYIQYIAYIHININKYK